MSEVERRHVLEQLASSIAAVRLVHPVRVAIDGVDAAGKTTLANELAVLVERSRPVIRASIDGFHRPAAVRRRRGALSPEGYFEDSFDYEALFDVLLLPLGPGGSRHFRRAVFDFRSDQPVESVLERADPHAVLLFDGVFLLRPGVREHFDFSIFVRADFSVTTARAEQRDAALLGNVEEVRRRYRERYVPGQQLYLASAEPERRATVVVDNNDPMRPAIVRTS